MPTRAVAPLKAAGVNGAYEAEQVEYYAPGQLFSTKVKVAGLRPAQTRLEGQQLRCWAYRTPSPTIHGVQHHNSNTTSLIGRSCDMSTSGDRNGGYGIVGQGWNGRGGPSGRTRELAGWCMGCGCGQGWEGRRRVRVVTFFRFQGIMEGDDDGGRGDMCSQVEPKIDNYRLTGWEVLVRMMTTCMTFSLLEDDGEVGIGCGNVDDLSNGIDDPGLKRRHRDLDGFLGDGNTGCDTESFDAKTLLSHLLPEGVGR
ncbi:hypothetical protein ARMGADRAFT_1056350 [Armillaria gallica]|uniref:Uncharacterized protein n=1 Tax=Armillaria gallica TaxID=47427 RepID=A0A2H3E9P2_ARMGA|nr:hypothetical protein ARMGADRAFT_1056350 [Armillaria gallica]